VQPARPLAAFRAANAPQRDQTGPVRLLTGDDKKTHGNPGLAVGAVTAACAFAYELKRSRWCRSFNAELSVSGAGTLLPVVEFELNSTKRSSFRLPTASAPPQSRNWPLTRRGAAGRPTRDCERSAALSASDHRKLRGLRFVVCVAGRGVSVSHVRAGVGRVRATSQSLRCASGTFVVLCDQNGTARAAAS
jgi:hypothetical protein